MRRTEYLLFYLHDPAGSFKALGLRTWYRAHNRILDLRARLAGACNADTWDEATSHYVGGYPHWRCGKRRGHPMPHRFVNTVWIPGQRTRYEPLPVRGLAEHRADLDQEVPFNRLTTFRHNVMPLRRRRAYDRMVRDLTARRRAERSAA
jgi:hypothetical protein